jgi:hypothetical protein
VVALRAKSLVWCCGLGFILRGTSIIITGYTISPIFISAAEDTTRGPKMASGIYQTPIRGFMDDLIVTISSHALASWVLSELGNKASVARIKLNLKKFRCLILRKGRPTNHFHLTIQDKFI